MMSHLQNHMSQRALGVLSQVDQVRMGTIQSYDPNTYSCKVLLQPEEVLTGWIPLLSPWVGNGWGMFAPPAPGAAVAIMPSEGGFDGAVLLPASFNDVDRPLPVPQGEFWLVHESGASFKLTNLGSLEITDNQGAIITLSGDGTVVSAGEWTHTGNLTVNGHIHSGNIISTGTIAGAAITDTTRSLSADRAIYNSHTHGTSGTPTQQE